MASYDEISTLLTNDTLRNRVTIATMIRANALISIGTPTPEEIKWAAAVFSNPEIESIKAFRVVDTVSATLVTAYSST